MVGGGGEVVRVQALAESGSGSGVPNIINVPSQFIQPPEKRPVLGPGPGPGGESGVPVVDLSDWEGAREEVGRACRDWGGFQVRNHGVGIGLLNQMRSAGLHLFRECSMEEKLRYSCDPHTPASEGYGSRMLQVVDNIESVVLDWRDYFDHHTFPLSRRDPTRWPQFLPNYRELVAAYSDEMKKLALKLLSLISQSLGLPSSCIQDKIWGEEEEEEEEVYQNVTVSYYPPCPRPDLTLGLQPHSDMGALTLLVQDDVGGLQLLKDDHNWVTVPPISDAILVLLADQTELEDCFVISEGMSMGCSLDGWLLDSLQKRPRRWLSERVFNSRFRVGLLYMSSRQMRLQCFRRSREEFLEVKLLHSSEIVNIDEHIMGVSFS